MIRAKDADRGRQIQCGTVWNSGRFPRHALQPGPAERPRPDLPAGADLIPQIKHIVVLMMENHSYDNYLGTLPGRGDGLPTGRRRRAERGATCCRTGSRSPPIT